MDFDQRAVLKNEISRQATIETMEQVGFLWEEAEDMEATDERPFADAPKRRARSHSEFSPALGFCVFLLAGRSSPWRS